MCHRGRMRCAARPEPCPRSRAPPARRARGRPGWRGSRPPRGRRARPAPRSSLPVHSASMPSAPDPANRSSARTPSSGPSLENNASRTRSDVGRVSRPAGAVSRRPPKRPATTRIRGGASGRHRRELDRGELVGQQHVLGRLEQRVLGEQPLRARVGALEQCGVIGQPREAESRQAGLARAGQLALAAQLEVDLGQPEAVGVLGQRAQPRRLLGPNSRHTEACSPRPTRPRSWCSCEMP